MEEESRGRKKGKERKKGQGWQHSIKAKQCSIGRTWPERVT